MKKNIKIILYLVLGFSLAIFVCGIVLSNLSCKGICDSIAHGGELDIDCPNFYFPPAASIAFIIVGSVGLIAVVAIFAVVSIIAERKLMAEMKASAAQANAESSVDTKGDASAKTDANTEVADTETR